MIHRLASDITDFFIEKNIIEKDESEIYTYGFDLLISGIINVVLVIVTGIITHRMCESLLYVSIMIIVRMYTGGYHADTKSVLSTVIAMSTIAAIPVFAAHASLDNGYAYNDVNHSNGMKQCNAGTINHVENEYSSLYVETTYYDGEVDSYWSDIVRRDAYYNSNWEWSEDYFSIHKLYESRGDSARDSVVLSED